MYSIIQKGRTAFGLFVSCLKTCRMHVSQTTLRQCLCVTYFLHVCISVSDNISSQCDHTMFFFTYTLTYRDDRPWCSSFRHSHIIIWYLAWLDQLYCDDNTLLYFSISSISSAIWVLKYRYKYSILFLLLIVSLCKVYKYCTGFYLFANSRLPPEEKNKIKKNKQNLFHRLLQNCIQ